MTTRRDQLVSQADDVGLYVRTWSPGDGVTRYRFFINPGNSYFGPESGIFTALGLKEAQTFVHGFGMGYATAIIDSTHLTTASSSGTL